VDLLLQNSRGNVVNSGDSRTCAHWKSIWNFTNGAATTAFLEFNYVNSYYAGRV